jgi:hypothetical protein
MFVNERRLSYTKFLFDICADMRRIRGKTEGDMPRRDSRRNVSTSAAA